MEAGRPLQAISGVQTLHQQAGQSNHRRSQRNCNPAVGIACSLCTQSVQPVMEKLQSELFDAHQFRCHQCAGSSATLSDCLTALSGQRGQQSHRDAHSRRSNREKHSRSTPRCSQQRLRLREKHPAWAMTCMRQPPNTRGRSAGGGASGLTPQTGLVRRKL